MATVKEQIAEFLSDPLSLPPTFLDYLTQHVTLNAPDSGSLRAPLLIPTGTTGATAAVRFVGGTTTGHPTTGSFRVGDWVHAQDAHIWVCTVAGSPGTWVDIGSTTAGTSALTPTAIKTGNYTAAVGDLVPVDITGGDVTITLPAAPADKSLVCVKLYNRTAPSTYTVSVTCGGSDVYEPAGPVAMSPTTIHLIQPGQTLLVQYRASSATWYLLENTFPPGRNIQNSIYSLFPGQGAPSVLDLPNSPDWGDPVIVLPNNAGLGAYNAAGNVRRRLAVVTKNDVTAFGDPGIINTYAPAAVNTFDIKNTAALSTILSKSIPKRTLGNVGTSTGALLATVQGFYLNNSGAPQTLALKVSFGGTAMWGDLSPALAASANPRPFYWTFLLAAMNATNAQQIAGRASIGDSGAGSIAGNGAWGNEATENSVTFEGAAAIDTSSSATLLIEAQHSAAATTIELKGSVHVEAVSWPDP